MTNIKKEQDELTYEEHCQARELTSDKKVEIVMDYNVGTSDYSKKRIQPWDIIDEYDLDFYEGNVLKYLLRTKGSRREDLEKIQHYIAKMLLNLEE
jgi:hypothetical protein